MKKRMFYDPEEHRRRSMRLQGFDYSQAGLYFITLCCHEKKCLFGKIYTECESGPAKMLLNEYGQKVKDCWLEIPEHFPSVVLHEHIVMPNHFHGIVEIVDNVGAKDVSPASFHPAPYLETIDISQRRSPSNTIGSIVRGFKAGVTKWIRNHSDIRDVWQRNYHEHIIRDGHTYQLITNYIQNNPEKWLEDRYCV